VPLYSYIGQRDWSEGVIQSPAVMFGVPTRANRKGEGWDLRWVTAIGFDMTGL
jgi:hypothetical protein